MPVWWKTKIGVFQSQLNPASKWVRRCSRVLSSSTFALAPLPSPSCRFDGFDEDVVLIELKGRDI